MRDDQTPDQGARDAGAPAVRPPVAPPPVSPPPVSWKGRVVRAAQRLEQTKVTPTTVLLFMVFLAMLSGAAAAIGYASHHLLRR